MYLLATKLVPSGSVIVALPGSLSCQPDPGRQPEVVREEKETEVGRAGQDDDVGDGAERRPLPERNPQQQYEHPQYGADRAETQRGVALQPLVQDAPGIDAQPGPHQDRETEAVQRQADEQLGQTPQRTLADGDIGQRRRRARTRSFIAS